METKKTNKKRIPSVTLFFKKFKAFCYLGFHDYYMYEKIKFICKKCGKQVKFL